MGFTFWGEWMPKWERPCLRLLNWVHNYGRPQGDLRSDTLCVCIQPLQSGSHTWELSLPTTMPWMDGVPDSCAKSLVLLVFVCVCICEWEGLCDTHMWCMYLYMVGDYVIVCMKGGGECWLSSSVLLSLIPWRQVFFSFFLFFFSHQS